jgi:hypothetical protein
MASVWKSALLAALLAALALAPAADAHTLKVQRAANANKTFAKLVCQGVEGEATCLAQRPGSCKRLSQHRVRCSFYTTLELEDGSRSRCLSLVDWYVRGRSLRLQVNYLGVRSCSELKPPDEEPTP